MDDLPRSRPCRERKQEEYAGHGETAEVEATHGAKHLSGSGVADPTAAN